MKILRYYEGSNGKKQFEEWLDGLKDVVGVATIRRRLDRLAARLRGDSEPLVKVFLN